MITLDNCSFIGIGVHRKCFRHPNKDNLCIKVLVSNNTKECVCEKKYYRHLERRVISWAMIPRYFGEIETNLGIGSIFELIIDHDGTVSKTLDDYLSSEETTKEYCFDLINSLYLLRRYLLQCRIITMNLNPRNIACQKSKSGIVLYVVDNLGNTEFIPISSWSNYLARIKIERKWRHINLRREFFFPFNQIVNSPNGKMA